MGRKQRIKQARRKVRAIRAKLVAQQPVLEREVSSLASDVRAATRPGEVASRGRRRILRGFEGRP